MIVQWAKKKQPKNPIDNALRPTLTSHSSEREFRIETCKSPHMKRLSSCARTYPPVGYKLYPWGQERHKVAPLTYYGEGLP